MQLLYCDETNFQKVAGDFFVYGGIAIDASKASSLSKSIENIRKELGVPNDHILKFNPGPEGMPHEKVVQLKKSIMKTAVDHECKFLVNLLLHDIAKSSDDARRFGINTLCYHFDCLLHRTDSAGLVLIDRFTDKQLDAQLQEKLAIGLTFQQQYNPTVKMEHIVGYHITAIGQSHFCSLVDILLGSLRFAINAHTQKTEKHMPSAKTMLAQLGPLFFRESTDVGTEHLISPISLWFSPKNVAVGAYRAKYMAVKDFLAENGVAAGQPILG